MVKVIAELGINHESNEKIAQQLIDNAHKSGCWAVKFQYRNLKYGWHRSNKAILHSAGIMSRFERLPMQHLNSTEFEEVKKFFEEHKLKFFSPKEL